MKRSQYQNTAALAVLAIGLAASRTSAQSGGCCLPAQPATPTVQACVTLTLADCTTQGGAYLGDYTGCKAPLYAAPSTCDFVQYVPGSNGAPNGGQLNISGATLFRDFFLQPASTNDFANVNGNTISRPAPCSDVVPYAGFLDTNCDGSADATDQLAPNYSCPPVSPFYWIVQYRGVGSVEGFEEFTDNQLLGTIPTIVPSDRGATNRRVWANTGVKQNIGCPQADLQADGNSNNDSGTPIIPNAIDLAVCDTPTLLTAQSVTGTSADARWNRKPTVPGYGKSPRLTTSGQTSVLANLTRGALSLNTNNNPPITPAPDANTLYDTTVAWVPIVPITNRGTNYENIRYTELQYLHVTGRMPSGENLIAATRDVGSGTRNGFDNSIGVDPSWAVGDNLGPRVDTNQETNVGVVPVQPANVIFRLTPGERTQPTNCGGSGIMENSVKQRRLAIGYTGLFGGRAASLQRGGNIEILNVAKDVDDNGNAIPGFVPTAQIGDPIIGGCPTPDANLRPANPGFVRAGVNTSLDNADPLKGYQIGGNETFISRGDPFSGVGANSNPALSNLAARDYVRNIASSISAFTAAPAISTNNNMPGQYLAFGFILNPAPDALPDLTNPTHFVPNPSFQQSVQDFSRCNNTDNPTAFGTPNVAGFVPLRNTRVGLAVPGQYSDGSINGTYRDFNGNLGNITSGKKLNRRNRVAGDFNNDGVRNLNDAAKLMEALKDPRLFTTNEGISVGTGGGDSPMNDDFVIPEIIGDFDGDGDFNALDARYFADGLALDPATGKLNRALGFTAIDNAWQTLMSDNNYFDTQLATYPSNAGYKPGDSRADIAGSVQGPFRGAYPNGSDGRVDAKDIDYVFANRGNWTTIDQAVGIDLSADMNGDLIVNQADVDVMVLSILCTRYGDADLNGAVNAADVTIVSANQGLTPAGWADGDFNGDRVVDAADLAIVNANLGFTGPACGSIVCGDIDGNGARTSADIQAFTNVLVGTDLDASHIARSDVNGSGAANGLDAQAFVNCFLAP